MSTNPRDAFWSAMMRRWPDKWARLSDGFYTIKDKTGARVPFRMNADQAMFMIERHGMDVVLKSRQKGFCLAPETRVLTADLRWEAIADLRPGQSIIGVDEEPPGGRGKMRKMREATVIAVVEVERPAFRITFEDGRSVVCTDQHPWLSKRPGTDPKWRPLSGRSRLKIGTHVRSITTPWGAPDYEDGWFGGILDGEGTMHRGDATPRVAVCQRAGAVWERMCAYVRRKGYSPTTSLDPGSRASMHGTNPVHRQEFGRMDEIFRLLGQTRPSRMIEEPFWRDRVLPGKRSDAKVWFEIVAIEPVATQKLIDLQTTTGTYIAEGFVSHNTTVIQLDMLDDCLFIPDTSAGVIAHNLNDAKAFFRDKIKFAYDELPLEFREQVRADSDSAESLRFSNGSSIRVGTSLRSGTLQRLHISEYGKLCAKYPEKAEEVKSGAFNTVQVGQNITVESTAEGVSGHFHDICKTAQAMRDAGRELTPLDFKFHFAPWWTSPEYRMDAADTARTIITQRMADYFERLEHRNNISLTDGQRAWYAKKAEQQGDKMKQEFPSTPEEAFEASIEGAYLATEMMWLRKERRICSIPIVNAPVDTFWDLGVNDDMVIWFRQKVGPEHRFVDYYANSGEGLEHYAQVLQKKAEERRWNYGTHHMPHDGRHRRLGLRTDSVEEMALSVGIKPIVIVPRVASNLIGIEASRRYLRQCFFDERNCAEGIECLDGYRKEWDDNRGVYKNTPVHDKASHGYKAFETAARAPDMYDYSDEYDVGGIDGAMPGYVGNSAPDNVTGY